jgi:hypothetical protein
MGARVETQTRRFQATGQPSSTCTTCPAPPPEHPGALGARQGHAQQRGGGAELLGGEGDRGSGLGGLHTYTTAQGVVVQVECESKF